MSATALRLLVAGIFVVACGSQSEDRVQRGDLVIPACAVPAAAETFDATNSIGCAARSIFKICSVPEGSVIHADGTITTPSGETVTCSTPCSPTDYSLSCYGADGQPIPSPDARLSCRAIPVPTPPDALFYCCPCGA